MLHLFSGINSLLLSVHLIPCYRRLAFSCSCHIFFLRWFTSFTIRKSLTLSLPTYNLPPSQIFPTIDSLPALELTPRTSWSGRFFWASRFSFLVLFITFSVFVVSCNRLSWLPVSSWTHKNNVSYVGYPAFSAPHRGSRPNVKTRSLVPFSFF